MMLLISSLTQLIGVTTILSSDEEPMAVDKLLCRIWACRIAQVLYKGGCEAEAVLHWKEISENVDEFVEIRSIEFVKD